MKLPKARRKTVAEPTMPWVIGLNAQYQKVVNTLITLSTAALILPVFFLRDLIGNIPPNTSLLKSLQEPTFCEVPVAFWSWGCFSASILSGILFYYVSATRIKEAWGQKNNTLFIRSIKGKKTVQYWLFATFDFCVVFFLLGIFALLSFAIEVVPAT